MSFLVEYCIHQYVSLTSQNSTFPFIANTSVPMFINRLLIHNHKNRIRNGIFGSGKSFFVCKCIEYPAGCKIVNFLTLSVYLEF